MRVIKHTMGYYRMGPSEIDGLFFDRWDYHGLLFMYDYLLEIGHITKNKK